MSLTPQEFDQRKAEFQPKKKTSIGKIVLYIFLVLLAFAALGSIVGDDETTQTAAVAEVKESTSNEAASESKPEPVVSKVDDQESIIKAKLKKVAARDWPNDYTTQEYWVDQQLEDYRYMITIADDDIKRQAQRDWPLDFTTQKFWYNQQIEAKERMEQ